MILRKMVYLLALVALQGRLVANCDLFYREGSIFDFEGDWLQYATAAVAATSPTGTTSATGISGTFVIDHLFNSLSAGPGFAILTLNPGDPVPFNGTLVAGTTVVAGTGITQPNTTVVTTFTFTKTGHYSVQFIANTIINLLGSFTFTLNRAPQGITSPIISSSASVPLQQVINVTQVPSTLQVINNSLTPISLAPIPTTAATITIIELSTP